MTQFVAFKFQNQSFAEIFDIFIVFDHASREQAANKNVIFSDVEDRGEFICSVISKYFEIVPHYRYLEYTIFDEIKTFFEKKNDSFANIFGIHGDAEEIEKAQLEWMQFIRGNLVGIYDDAQRREKRKPIEFNEKKEILVEILSAIEQIRSIIIEDIENPPEDYPYHLIFDEIKSLRLREDIHRILIDAFDKAMDYDEAFEHFFDPGESEENATELRKRVVKWLDAIIGQLRMSV